ncbi:MAG TPA: glycosyltransferase family 4 protein [Defluviitaleaceae bacterium]|nr:glycosyltransferase family 4 protein [Defluviitaleaceae bacterium]
MKILLVNADNGGIMHYAVDLANHLVQTQEVIVIAKKSAERLLNKNCEMITIDDSRNLKLVFSEFKKALLKYEPDIVHFTGYHPLYIILSHYISKKGISSIYTIHDAKRNQYKKIFFKNIRDRIIFNKFTNQRLINLSTNIVALSSYVAGQIKALYKADAVVIPLSQDVERYNFINYDVICKENRNNEESIRLLSSLFLFSLQITS